MKIKHIFLIAFLIGFSWIGFLFASSQGPATGYNGINDGINTTPSSDSNNCGFCHHPPIPPNPVGTRITKDNAMLTFTGLPTQWIPGWTYPLSVNVNKIVNQTASFGYGFQLSAVQDNNSTQPASGGFSNLGPNLALKVSPFGVAPLGLANIQYIEHTARIANNLASSMNWTAPSDSFSGAIRFNLAAIADLGTAGVQTDDNLALFATAVPKDTSAPVSIVGLTAGTAVSGTTFTVSATLSANAVQAQKVQFKLDGTTNIGAADTTAPYSVVWNTTSASNGSHILTAEVTDSANFIVASSGVSVIVDNAAPSVNLTAPTTGTFVSGTSVALTANPTDTGSGVAGVQFKIDNNNLGTEKTSSPFTVNWDTTSFTNAAHTITAVARDQAGNLSPASPAVSVTVDNLAPSVSITAPVNNAIVSGSSVTVSASADDLGGSGVAGVLFKLDGNNLGAEDTSSPFSVVWNTTTVANGTHSLTAVARDVLGNSFTSTGVTLTVSNAGTPPGPLSISEFTPTGASGPFAIVKGPDGALWFTEQNTHKIGKITTAGVINEFNPLTANSAPSGITAGPDGNLWFTEYVANKIGQITTSGTVKEFNIPTVASGAYAITVGPDNLIWFYEKDASKIGRIRTDGTFAGEFPIANTGQSVNCIASGPDGALWYTEHDSNKIGRMNTSGTVTNEYTLNGGPNCIVTGPDGKLWVTEDASRIAKITVSGTSISIQEFTVPKVGTGASTPNSITIGEDSALWFTDHGSSNSAEIGRIDTNGAVTQFPLIPGNSLPKGIAAAGGSLWFTEQATNKIGRLDDQAPTISIATPSAGLVAGSVTITANTSDNVAVVGVQFVLDGSVAIGAEVTSAPFSIAWDSKSASNGAHSITAIARDAALFRTTSTPAVAVTVDNILPTVSFSTPVDGAFVTGTLTVTAIASDNIAVAGVQFKVDDVNFGAEDTTSPYSFSWNTVPLTNAIHKLTAVARDTANNTVPAIVNVTVDNLLPAVSIAPPLPSFVGGTIQICANASDNNSVAGVQFKLDTANFGAEDTSSPYCVNWDTKTATNAAHTITATARDVVGLLQNATSVTVTVDNIAPTVNTPTVTIPPTGCGVTISTTALDANGIAGISFFVDGLLIGPEDTTSPYSVVWNSITSANGTHSITAVARDIAQNTSPISTAVSVTVPVGSCPPSFAPRTFSITGLSSPVSPKALVTIQANISSAYSVDLGLNLKMNVTPKVQSAMPSADDFAFASGGGKTLSCTVPKNTTAVTCGGSTSISVQFGTIASDIQFTAESLTASGEVVSPALAAGTTSIAPARPEVIGVSGSTTGAKSFNVVVIGYSTSRDITKATFSFTGTNIKPDPVTVTFGTLFSDYFDKPESFAAGSVFKLTMPFSITTSSSDVKGVSVTLTNSQGVSVGGASSTGTIP